MPHSVYTSLFTRNGSIKKEIQKKENKQIHNNQKRKHQSYVVTLFFSLKTDDISIVTSEKSWPFLAIVVTTPTFSAFQRLSSGLCKFSSKKINVIQVSPRRWCHPGQFAPPAPPPVTLLRTWLPGQDTSIFPWVLAKTKDEVRCTIPVSPWRNLSLLQKVENEIRPTGFSILRLSLPSAQWTSSYRAADKNLACRIQKRTRPNTVATSVWLRRFCELWRRPLTYLLTSLQKNWLTDVELYDDTLNFEVLINFMIFKNCKAKNIT